MEEITIQELMTRSDQVFERIALGESVTVTRDGKSLAHLSLLDGPHLSTRALLRRWTALPAMDPASLRHDIDAIFGQA